jgi:MFS family permease
MPPDSSFKRNVPLLALCQALFMSGSSLLVATSALVGFSLAEDKTYASLAFTVQLLATMLASIPAAALMSRIGRKPAFMTGTVIAAAGAITCTLAILEHRFWLFILGSALLGIFSGFANYYRFAAADNVDEAHKSRAIAYVLAGGVLAAFIGPNLANLTRDSLGGAAFAGSYASIVVLYVLSFALLGLLRLPQQYQAFDAERHSGRPLLAIARQPRFIIAVITGMLGYATMTLVMTATPLAMQHHHHPFSDTSFVIQWHVLAMFAPSFFTGQLIQRFGLVHIMTLGALLGLACVVINLMGTSVNHFWLALLLLGLSWNFLFIGATTLLTEVYVPEERFKTQALNDFLVFSVVAAASLSAGALHHQFGWQLVNYAALPMVAVILLSLAWLSRINRGPADTAINI